MNEEVVQLTPNGSFFQAEDSGYSLFVDEYHPQRGMIRLLAEHPTGRNYIERKAIDITSYLLARGDNLNVSDLRYVIGAYENLGHYLDELRVKPTKIWRRRNPRA